MLYAEHEHPALDPEAFANPGPEYRGAPFWSWNTAVTDSLVMNQIDIFEKMGFGGFHIHPRTGMDTVYLGKEYLRLVRLANEYGKQKRMLCWLYDEDRYPSGTAGGECDQKSELQKTLSSVLL